MNKEQLKILIVEDEMIIAMDLQKVLMNYNYSVCSIVCSGFEAIKKVYEEKPDLILMDIMIPGELNGIDTAKIIRNEFDVPVVFLTALNDDENYMSAYEVSKYGYIVKPYNENELRGIIENAIKQHKLNLKRVM